ncbi:PREDICTED: RNA pseudouridylate synthase domain-containing protein 4-like [Vollenhovia emeryi]|uniref:RNA pseudouridylate synthase domain-containing protein 4-like n=1 Tax=Vollenhovia emeryi TaxID=411798 RepID=UPI0005F3BAD2|nr:PREDICTED: RNA pseudouridylate synthase domain-containing protein 4-like [Vollenhovia emeryi]XP_011877897.1 PREDICTED: RNA pseudouridylate synthase domain-containing protein 4-like [Vollenhovia emeryi]XP_011877898.1 PREDICTED: RNA pseudouridylate synthase domain-containing protein 4-like [Vollenhovia emeryi]XP_011877899.1 PREDICTED: RNA pseudouridylate synthase domain-containing protein 4-like [Vollenhovia emeryi]XP_011877900.1 PREDICTED: RNA pseudouridylate synthase domain-containing protei
MRGAMTVFRSVRLSELAVAFRACHRSYCTESYTTTTNKVVHPYCQIHPWKSLDEFAKDLLKNVIYNKDGIIAINKPYGISLLANNLETTKVQLPQRQQLHKIVGEVNYSVQDAFPYLAKELDVPILIPCLGSEKYMSGTYVFGTDDKVCKQIEQARQRSQGRSKKLWVVTTRVPNEIKGQYHLGMTLKTSALGDKKPIIMTQWANNKVKRNEVKIMNISHKVLSNSTHNLSSLIEIESSARKWNGIRLFASTMLYSPILGDNVHGSRVQHVMGTWMKVDPFADSCSDMPKLNRQLLDLLDVTPKQQEIIPTHMHLRSVHLIYGKEKEDIIIEAPLAGAFDWTCRQLMFKLPGEERNAAAENNEEKLAYV